MKGTNISITASLGIPVSIGVKITFKGNIIAAIRSPPKMSPSAKPINEVALLFFAFSKREKTEEANKTQFRAKNASGSTHSQTQVTEKWT